ncbi:MAG: hypothetical protein GC155_06070 [Alphaproteobacteria bacterium]|nr:hypothetical protein [Alphaproteobacteria bacterium]
MNFVRKPWNETEVDLLRHLVGCRLSPLEIADTLAIAGYPVRETKDVFDKAKALRLTFSALNRETT